VGKVGCGWVACRLSQKKGVRLRCEVPSDDVEVEVKAEVKGEKGEGVGKGVDSVLVVEEEEE